MDSIYTIRDSPGEGLGCFATTCISPGTLILSEAPLFSVREPRTNSAVISAFAGLDHLQQELYLTLYAQKTTAEGDARVIDIFNSNAWQTGSCTSICPLAARFNHSCVPNASFAWNSRTSQITVHAIVAIPAGLVGEALGLAYHDATIGWKKYGRLDLALQTAVKELEIAVICFGRDSPAVDASTASVSELKAEYAEQSRHRPVLDDTELLEVLDKNLVDDLHLV
ncbi:SET domain-containing protein [Pyrenophora tritici-repentis]|nr:SET domain-containing protein [Pyrenophora tritici-repentis]KAI1683222.1 SET domain-containing protein [Pyrenophora tritici-repentis]